MKNFILLILLIILTFTNSFAQSRQSYKVDKLIIGDSASANDTTIELSPTNKIRHNKTNGKTEFTNDGTIWKKLGSGSGGGAGAPSIIDNGGFEDGINVGWSYSVGTVAAVTGSSALLPDANGTSASFDPASLNDYIRSSYYTVPKGLRGAACEARFLYIGGDAANYSAKVETESGVVLGTYLNDSGLNVLPSHSSANYESVFFKCPTDADITTLSTNGNVRVVIYQGTSTNATAMVVDDFHLGGLIGLVEAATPDTFTAYISSTGTVTKENVDWINGNCSVATSTFTCNFVSTLVLSNSLNCTVATVQANTEALIFASNTTNLQTRTYVETTSTLTAYDHIVICNKTGSDAKQSVQVYKSIPKVSDNVNTFSASVSSAGAVTGENVDFINGSCALSGTSNYIKTCSFNSGIFSVAPVCTATVSGSNVGLRLESATTSSTVTIGTLSNVSTGNTGGFDIVCIKSSTDFKMPTVQPIVIGQVTNSAAESGLVNVRVESCQINNSGTATVDTTSGLCSGWISSVSRTGSGTVLVNFIAGKFSSAPVCTLAGVNYHTLSTSATTSSITINTYGSVEGTLADSNFFISCTGKR